MFHVKQSHVVRRLLIVAFSNGVRGSRIFKSPHFFKTIVDVVCGGF